jgi:VIT1/CCC1 family predicted Fe2+/Mn2+ transporter
VPLLIYLVGLAVPVPAESSFLVSFLLSGFALFGLGAAKVLVTQLNVLRSGLEMLLVGGLAAGVAYVVGALLKGIGG